MRWIYIWVNNQRVRKAASAYQLQRIHQRAILASLPLWMSQSLDVSTILIFFVFYSNQKRATWKQEWICNQQHTVYIRIKSNIVCCVHAVVGNRDRVFSERPPSPICKCLNGVRHAIRRYVTLGNCLDVWLCTVCTTYGIFRFFNRERKCTQEQTRDRTRIGIRWTCRTFVQRCSSLPHGVQYGSFVIFTLSLAAMDIFGLSNNQTKINIF